MCHIIAIFVLSFAGHLECAHNQFSNQKRLRMNNLKKIYNQIKLLINLYDICTWNYKPDFIVICYSLKQCPRGSTVHQSVKTTTSGEENRVWWVPHAARRTEKPFDGAVREASPSSVNALFDGSKHSSVLLWKQLYSVPWGLCRTDTLWNQLHQCLIRIHARHALIRSTGYMTQSETWT